MAEHTLELRLDRSIPFTKLKGFPRFLSWDDAETVTTPDRSITVRLVMSGELESLSPRWDAEYRYGITIARNEDGQPVFCDFPHGSVPAESGVLECALQPGKNYIRVERAGGTLRDWKGGEALIGTSVWSRAMVSGLLVVEAK